MRLLFVTDLHGSTLVFEKALQAVELYDIDVLLIGGDLSGKRLVPIVPTGGNHYVAWEPYKQKDDTGHAVDKPVQIDVPQSALADNLRRLEAKGMYWHVGTESEIVALNNDPTALRVLFDDKIVERLSAWAQLADRLLPSEVRCFWTGGNDDSHDTLERLTRGDLGRFEAGEGNVIALDGYDVISLGYSNRTPFETDRELDEPEISQVLQSLAGRTRNADRIIMNVHVPPVDCGGIDVCVDPRDPTRRIHVGSSGVRTFIENYQPLADFAGHVHEGKGTATIGRTRVFNPGSDYFAGVMNAYVVSLSDESITNHYHIMT